MMYGTFFVHKMLIFVKNTTKNGYKRLYKTVEKWHKNDTLKVWFFGN